MGDKILKYPSNAVLPRGFVACGVTLKQTTTVTRGSVKANQSPQFTVKTRLREVCCHNPNARKAQIDLRKETKQSPQCTMNKMGKTCTEKKSLYTKTQRVDRVTVPAKKIIGLSDIIKTQNGSTCYIQQEGPERTNSLPLTSDQRLTRLYLRFMPTP